MKLPIHIITSMLILTSIVSAATPEEESRFLNAVRDAYTKKDKDAIIALTCWDRVTEQHRKLAPKVIDHAVSRPIKSVQYRAVDASAAQVYTKDGVTYGPNLPITKQIEIEYVVESGSQKSQLFIGEKEAKLMIVNLTPQP
jgi:hypothetical protein